MPARATRHDAPAWPPGAKAPVLWPCLFLLVAMFNLTLVVAGLKEFILDDLGGTVRHATLFFSVETFAYIVFAPLWGLASDRLGLRKPFIVVGFLGSGLFYASFAVLDDVELLLSLRFVQGAFSVMGWSILMASVLDRAGEPGRGRMMGLMGGSLILGVSLGAPIGGYVTRALGPRAPLEVAAVLFLLLAFGSLLLPSRHVRPAPTRLGAITTALRRRPRLVIPMLFHFVDRFTVGFFVVVFPLYIDSLGATDPAVRGRYLALFLLPFALLQYVSGRLTDAVGPYRPLVLGSLAYGIVLCVVGYAGLMMLWPIMVALGVLAAVMFPPAITLTAQLSSPTTRGTAMGAFNFAGSLGFAVGPLVGGLVYEWKGYDAAFLLSGAMEIALAVGAGAVVLRWASRGEL
ncbi:MAG: MFS transporter [Thermoanaerobaculia bacterium]|nr:MFS transporter [Thermoanaerobaculia bacterium]